MGHNALLFQNPTTDTDMQNTAVVGYGVGAQITTGTFNTLMGEL